MSSPAPRRQFFLTPTYACDEDCLMCGVPRATRLQADRLSPQQWMDEVDRMELRPTDILTLSGGEPTRSKDFNAIVRYARTRFDCQVWVLSNGRRLRDPQFAASLKDIGITKFVIPIFSHRPEVHDKITQRANSFRDTWEGLRNLERQGIRFQIKFIATRLNYTDALATYLLCKAEFPTVRFVFSGLTMFGESVSNADQVAIRYSEAAVALDELLAEADARNDLVPVFIFPLCHIDPTFWNHYNVAQFEEVVVAPDRRDIADGRTLNEGPKPPACNRCIARQRCVFGWKPSYHALYGDTEFKPMLAQ